MALSSSLVWRVRADGAQTNGGGFDATVSGAGTDYSDQASPQLSITDLTSTNSTTVTSVLSTFTAAMVGNVLRIASGTGATTGYYMVATYVNASTITLDRVSGTYTAGVAKIGGATDSLKTYSNGGTATAPTLTTPLAAGHKIMLRGAGTNDPTTADYTQTGHYTYPAGNTTSGAIQLIGYNGRPLINIDGLAFYQMDTWRFNGIKLKFTSNTNGSFGAIFTQGGAVVCDNIYLDAAGQDNLGVGVSAVINSRFTNSGSTSAGTSSNAAISLITFNTIAFGNFIKEWRGSGMLCSSNMGTICNNIVISCKKYGISILEPGSTYPTLVIGNTINGNTLDGVYITDANSTVSALIMNNIITANGGYGLNCTAGTAALNDKLTAGKIDYNNYGTGGTANTSGARNNISAGAHDVALDPQFTNTGADNYSIGANMKNIGFPSAFSTTATTSYVDLGAVQAAAGGGGGGGGGFIISG